MTENKRKQTIRILAIIALLLSFCNGLLQAYNWQYDGVTTSHLASIFFMSILWTLLYGFTIGILTTLIPFKELKYKQRYLPNAFACIIVVAILFILSAIRSIYYTKYLYNFNLI